MTDQVDQEQLKKQNYLKQMRDNRAKNFKRKSATQTEAQLMANMTGLAHSPNPTMRSKPRGPTWEPPVADKTDALSPPASSTLNQTLALDNSIAQLNPPDIFKQPMMELPRYPTPITEMKRNEILPNPGPLSSDTDHRRPSWNHFAVDEMYSPTRQKYGGHSGSSANFAAGVMDHNRSPPTREHRSSFKLTRLMSMNMQNSMSKQSPLQFAEQTTDENPSFFSSIKMKFKRIFGRKKQPDKADSQNSLSFKGENSASVPEKRKGRISKSVIGKLQIAQKEKDISEEAPQQYIETDIMSEVSESHLQNLFHKGFIEALNLRKFGFVIPADHPGKHAWNLVVIFATACVGFILPMSLAFDDFDYNTALGVIINMVFSLDILANMTTSFYHPEVGEIVKNPKVIRKYYLTSFGFALDLLAVLPLHLLPQLRNKVINFKLLKLLKLVRLQPSLIFSIQSETAKLSMKIFILFFYLVFYTHSTACYLYHVVEKEKVWEPSRTLFEGADFYQSDLQTRYLTCLYTSIMVLMGNDTKPETNFHMGVTSFFTITGALIIANVFGTITVVVSALNRKSQKFQDKIDSANTSMGNMKLPPSIQQDIREFMMSTQNNLDTQKELDAFMQMISPSLRNQVTKHIFLNAIASNPVLQGSQDVIDFLINDVSTLLYMPEDRIVNQGEQGANLYLIAKGDCSVWVVDHMKQQRFVRQLNQGEYFGEVSILYETPRTATVKSQNYCTLASLSSKTFFDLCNNFPQIIARMRERTLDYDDPWKQFKKKVLGQIDYFEKPDPDLPYFLDDIQYHLREEYFEKGTEIAGPDCPQKQLIFIVSGLVEVVVFDKDGNEEELDTLGQGSHIGQYSVLFDETPIFSAVAKTQVRALTLSQEFFLENKDVIEGLEDAIFECEDTVEVMGLPVCDYQKFFKQDNIRSKFLRAKRKATILEKSVSMTKNDGRAPDTTSNQNYRPSPKTEFEVARKKRQSILVRGDLIQNTLALPKRRATRKLKRNEVPPPPSAMKISASMPKKPLLDKNKRRRFTIMQHPAPFIDHFETNQSTVKRQLSGMIPLSGIGSSLSKKESSRKSSELSQSTSPRPRESSRESRSSESKSCSSSSSDSSSSFGRAVSPGTKPMEHQSRQTSQTSSHSLSQSNSSSSSSRRQAKVIFARRKRDSLMKKKKSSKGRVTFQVNNISDISEEVKEEEKSSVSSIEEYNNEHLYDSDNENDGQEKKKRPNAPSVSSSFLRLVQKPETSVIAKHRRDHAGGKTRQTQPKSKFGISAQGEMNSNHSIQTAVCLRRPKVHHRMGSSRSIISSVMTGTPARTNSPSGISPRGVQQIAPKPPPKIGARHLQEAKNFALRISKRNLLQKPT